MKSSNTATESWFSSVGKLPLSMNHPERASYNLDSLLEAKGCDTSRFREPTSNRTGQSRQTSCRRRTHGWSSTVDRAGVDRTGVTGDQNRSCGGDARLYIWLAC